MCVGYVLAKEPKLMPLIGARKPAQLDVLDREAAHERPTRRIWSALLPPGAFKGDRYPTAMMAHLDSEK